MTLTDFEKWMQLAKYHQKLQNSEFGWLWKKWGRRVFVGSRTFKCEGERNGHMLHYEQVVGNVFKRRESKYCAVMMKHSRKVKGEQVIILPMAQQLKTKNINVVPRQLFCCQCKAKFVRDRLTVLIIKINFNLLQTLTTNSLNIKYQGKSTNHGISPVSLHAFMKTLKSNISEAYKV